MWDAAETLDYLQLTKEAKKLDTSACAKELRLAVLGDFAVQQLLPLVQVLCARRGVRVEIYEGGYDAIDAEILNPQSGLYAFKPQYVAVLPASEKLKARFYESHDRAGFAAEVVNRFSGLWEALARNSKATVIQGNFVMPSERAFGNYEGLVAESMGANFAAANNGLALAARGAKNVLLCDVDHIAAAVGRRDWADERLWSLAKLICHPSHLPLLARELSGIMLAASGRFVKCVVLDLDNTLWGGVIGDDGLSGIVLGDFDEGEAFVAFQYFLRELKRRGIVLAVVSKNDHANAIQPFREHPGMVLKEEDIAVFVANWENKADNIRLVQKTLNIGFDSILFIDDNKFERNLVREFLPEVMVPELPEDPALYIRALSDLNLFETTSYSDADRERSDQYREEAKRETVKASFTNISDYLASLQMQIKLERFSAFNLPRIAQLIQRSNQFNLTTRRHSEAVCEGFMNDRAQYAPFTLTLNDKFGNYGLISVIILKLQSGTVEIDEYLMSCRVLQRGVEQFAMNKIFAFAKRMGARRVIGRYIPTDKNAMVKDFYAGFGFEKTSEKNGETEWALDVDRFAPKDTFLAAAANEL